MVSTAPGTINYLIFGDERIEAIPAEAWPMKPYQFVTEVATETRYYTVYPTKGKDSIGAIIRIDKDCSYPLHFDPDDVCVDDGEQLLVEAKRIAYEAHVEDYMEPQINAAWGLDEEEGGD